MSIISGLQVNSKSTYSFEKFENRFQWTQFAHLLATRFIYNFVYVAYIYNTYSPPVPLYHA
jgi:hypothetical protein